MNPYSCITATPTYGVNSDTCTLPTGDNYNCGVAVGYTAPAKWWNGLFGMLTYRVQETCCDINSILCELNNVICCTGGVPDATKCNQLYSSIDCCFAHKTGCVACAGSISEATCVTGNIACVYGSDNKWHNTSCLCTAYSTSANDSSCLGSCLASCYALKTGCVACAGTISNTSAVCCTSPACVYGGDNLWHCTAYATVCCATNATNICKAICCATNVTYVYGDDNNWHSTNSLCTLYSASSGTANNSACLGGKVAACYCTAAYPTIPTWVASAGTADNSACLGGKLAACYCTAAYPTIPTCVACATNATIATYAAHATCSTCSSYRLGANDIFSHLGFSGILCIENSTAVCFYNTCKVLNCVLAIGFCLSSGGLPAYSIRNDTCIAYSGCNSWFSFAYTF